MILNQRNSTMELYRQLLKQKNKESKNKEGKPITSTEILASRQLNDSEGIYLVLLGVSIDHYSNHIFLNEKIIKKVGENIDESTCNFITSKNDEKHKIRKSKVQMYIELFETETIPDYLVRYK